jgi:hypothetical protein
MWEGIEDGQATKCDLSWLVQEMKSDSLLWVTDGSYDRKRAPVLSGVGWIIFCQRTGKRLVVSSLCRQALTEQSFSACARSIY